MVDDGVEIGIPEPVETGDENRARVELVRGVVKGQLEQFYPNTEFTHLYSGSSAEVFTSPEHPDRVYKVAYDTDLRGMDRTGTTLYPNNPKDLEYMHREVEHIRQIQDSGLGPQLYAVHETPEVLVIEMEKIEFEVTPPYERPYEETVPAIRKVRDYFLAHNLYPGDVEIGFDKNGRIRMVDVGGLYNMDYKAEPNMAKMMNGRMLEFFQVPEMWARSEIRKTDPNGRYTPDYGQRTSNSRTFIDNTTGESVTAYFEALPGSGRNDEIEIKPLPLKKGDQEISPLNERKSLWRRIRGK